MLLLHSSEVAAKLRGPCLKRSRRTEALESSLAVEAERPLLWSEADSRQKALIANINREQSPAACFFHIPGLPDIRVCF